MPSRILSIVFPDNDAVGGQPKYDDTLYLLLVLADISGFDRYDGRVTNRCERRLHAAHVYVASSSVV